MADTRPYRISDGQTAAPSPPVYPPQRLPLPNEASSNGTMHSPTIAWPPPQEPPTKPYKSLR